MPPTKRLADPRPCGSPRHGQEAKAVERLVEWIRRAGREVHGRHPPRTKHGVTRYVTRYVTGQSRESGQAVRWGSRPTSKRSNTRRSLLRKLWKIADDLGLK